MKQYRKSNALDFSGLQISDTSKRLLQKGLSLSLYSSYHSVDEVLTDIQNPNARGSHIFSGLKPGSIRHPVKKEGTQEQNTVFEFKRGTGRGFEDIAGMHDLKNMLQQKVIFVLENKELAEKYRLRTPNGMLLYGPPGCGKSYFAEKFAEQTSFNFLLIKSSDLASVYIHGTQEKIGELFKQAEKNAPTVLCFDEFDAFVQKRSSLLNGSLSGEVNEFLSQLNNCSQRGIFVIATSNRPDQIDPAVLRSGRIDNLIYVPMPDEEARSEMFAIHLKGRPYDEESVDCAELATMTEGYIASDIELIVNNSAMAAAFNNGVITQEMIVQSIHETPPSINHEVVLEYEQLREKIEGTGEHEPTTSKIGYKIR